MPVFIEMVTDPYEEVLQSQKSKKYRDGRTARAGRRVARRPTRGLEIKDDTAAAVKVILADGSELPLVDSSSPDGLTTSGYANFILQQVQEQRMEKHQIVETFGASYVYFFGENPRFLNVQAILVNSHDFNWEAEWWENYNKYFRGTRLVELGARLYLFYDDNIVEGYMLNSQAVKVAGEPFLIQLSFTLYVTNYQNVSFIGNPHFPIRASVEVPPGVELTGGRAAEDMWVKFNHQALSQAQSENIGAAGQDIKDVIGTGTFGQGKRLSAFLRQVPATLDIAPDVRAAINRLGTSHEGVQLTELMFRNSKPLRELIAANIDEYVGSSSPYFGFQYGMEDAKGGLPSALAPLIRGQQEVDDLFQAAIAFLGCYGADIDNPTSMRGLGLLARVDPYSGATYKPQSGAGFGYGLNAGVGAGVGPDGETSAYSYASGKYSRDPLGAVYGSGNERARTGDNRFVAGAGDPWYGYYSDYAAAPGFGRAGFGDFGGGGYGGALGAGGDPGFRDPRTFTFAGVDDHRSAFQRFVKPKQDASQFGVGIGLGASTTGLTGSASFKIKGKVSTFSLVSVAGNLDVTGRARQDPSVASGVGVSLRLGFGLGNPNGFNCPQPGGIGLTLSTGGVYGAGASVGLNNSLI